MTDKQKSLSEKRAAAGAKGGRARVQKGFGKQTSERRSEIARKGGLARWKKNEN